MCWSEAPRLITWSIFILASAECVSAMLTVLLLQVLSSLSAGPNNPFSTFAVTSYLSDLMHDQNLSDDPAVFSF